MSLKTPDLSNVTFGGGFWGPRIETLLTVTLPTQYKHLEDTSRIAGLDPTHAAGDPASRHKFWDSDIAKWMEAAACSLSTRKDSDLEQKLESLITALGSLQCADGYLNSWFTSVYPDRRWTNLRDDHELYCAGHLIEAAIAYQKATGRTKFVEIMIRYVDLIAEVFGSGIDQRPGYPGHEEIELALVKLFEVTGDEKHLNLARYFIDQRGKQPHYFGIEADDRGDDHNAPWGGHEYFQAHIPVRKQNTAIGHAVRAMYLYAGMTDIWALTGDRGLEQAVRALWDNVCSKQMYLTGSVGAAGFGEKFTFDYDLPEETSYCETCAAIGLVFWNQRLLNHEGDGRYADIIERALYNGVLSGISLQGDRYFYVNPLATTGTHHRQEWFGCACCPPNIARLLASLGQYVYSEGRDAWVNLYATGTGVLNLDGGQMTLAQETSYPWNGSVKITVSVEDKIETGINLRLPGWARNITIEINGDQVEISKVERKGYAHLDRIWESGDVITIEMPMPVERVYANPQVRMSNGKVALQRGPIVYCLEETDNEVSPLSRIAIPPESDITSEHQGSMLGGVTVLSGEAVVFLDGGDSLYTTSRPEHTTLQFKAIPYYAWDNREAGHMQVWLREAAG